MAVGGIDGSMSGPTTANTHVPRSTVRDDLECHPRLAGGEPISSVAAECRQADRRGHEQHQRDDRADLIDCER